MQQRDLFSTTFQYKALKTDGEQVFGSLEARSLLEAKAKLREMGYIILHLEDTASKDGKKLSMDSSQRLFFFTQLAQLLESNIPLFDSLEVLEDQIEGEQQAQQPIIEAIKEKIQRGCSFTEALGEYPYTFSQTHIAILSAGEAVGEISTATRRVATLLAKEAAMKNKLISALIYPALLTGLLCIALSIMLFFVIPSLQSLFEGRKLPVFTTLIFSFSHFANAHIPLILSSFITLFIWAIFEYKYPFLRMNLSTKALYWPYIGPFLIKSSLARFTRTLAMLLQGGTPLNIALEKSEAIISNPILLTALKMAREKVLEGHMLSDSFTHPLLPKLFRRMIALGEETGKLDDLIEQISDLYEDETSRILDRITSLIQPVLLILFGLIIGSILIAILLPLSDFGSFLSL